MLDAGLQMNPQSGSATANRHRFIVYYFCPDVLRQCKESLGDKQHALHGLIGYKLRNIVCAL